MEYVRFGLTDLNISRIGMGCAAIGGYDYGSVDDQESLAAVQRALDLGINLFDTADVYGFGHSEEILSRALAGRRHEVVIATKFGVNWNQEGKTFRDLSAKRVVQALEASLRRLKLDCIPVYQIHWPDPKTPIAETLEALRKCQEAGKIRHIGCSNFPADLVDQAQACCRVESIQMPYSLAERAYWETIRWCRERHTMTILAYNPLAQGLFTGKYGAQSKFEGTDLRRRSELLRGDKLKSNLAILDRLRLVGDRHGRTPAQVAIRWILEDPSQICVLVGLKTVAQAEQNAGGAGWALPPEDTKFLTGSEGSIDS
ncbi:MAG: aldo/keto reductase [Terriglobia bacterium]